MTFTLQREAIKAVTEKLRPIAYYSRLRTTASTLILAAISWGLADPRLARYAVYTRAMDNELIVVKYIILIILIVGLIMFIPALIRALIGLPALEASPNKLRIHVTWTREVDLSLEVKSRLRSSRSFGLPMILYRDRERVTSELRHILRE